MQHLTAAHRKVVETITRKLNPMAGLAARSLYVTHGTRGYGPAYAATLHHPPALALQDALDGLGEAGQTTGERHAPDGKWITLHNGHPDEEAGTPVYVRPDKHGKWEITAGARNRLNGLKLSGIKDDDAYRALSSLRREQAKEIAKRAARLSRVQANEVARKTAAQGEEAGMQPQTHLLPLTRPQAQAYAESLGWYGLARSAANAGLTDRRALMRLAPQEFMGKDENKQEIARRLNGSLDMLREQALEGIVHGHPDGAKAAWISRFAAENKHEPLVVSLRDPAHAQALAARLEHEGHPTAVTYDDPEALLKFAPATGDAQARILLGVVPPGARLRPHHLILADSPAVTPDPVQHLSVHALMTDTTHERTKASRQALAVQQAAERA